MKWQEAESRHILSVYPIIRPLPLRTAGLLAPCYHRIYPGDPFNRVLIPIIPWSYLSSTHAQYLILDSTPNICLPTLIRSWNTCSSTSTMVFAVILTIWTSTRPGCYKLSRYNPVGDEILPYRCRVLQEMGSLNFFHFLLTSFLCSLVSANPIISTSASHSVFTSRQQQDVQLRFVKDSGVCETTPGVGQMSGYIDVGKNMSIVSLYWFGGLELKLTYAVNAVVLVL